MGVRDRVDALAIVRSVLAADYACPENAFSSDQMVVSSADPRSGGRRYARPDRMFEISTMGASVVVHCHHEHAAWVDDTLRSFSRDSMFSATTIALLAGYLGAYSMELAGPEPNYVCPVADLRLSDPPSGVEIDLVGTRDVHKLYRHQGFPNALSYRADALAPDILATVATRGGEVLGIAGATADSESMWQIGIDVAPHARSTGIGRALVSRLTQEVLRAGRLPYYAHDIANIPSGALAMSVGYRLAWIELHGKDRGQKQPSPKPA